jgi:hypothetical protein
LIPVTVIDADEVTQVEIQYKIENSSLSQHFSYGEGRFFFKENVGNVSSVLKRNESKKNSLISSDYEY